MASPYTRAAQRFFFNGICLIPSDALPAGKLPYARNIRSYEEGTIRPRAGLTGVSGAGVGAAVHSIGRLNDPTPFNGGNSALRFVGAGTEVFTGDPAGVAYSLDDSGYSGDPLTMVAAQPPQSPRPYLYVADSSRQRKWTTDTGPFEVGIAQPSAPSTEPEVAVQALKTRYIYGGVADLGVTWAVAGIASAPVAASRINTVIGQILYDEGTTGYCSIVPGAMTNLTTGTVVSVGSERAIVTDLTIAVAATTVAAIIYDSGSTGFCTIQPAGSLGTGQLDAPTWAEANRTRQISTGVRFAVPRGEIAFGPLPTTDAPRRRIRQVDFPVNCLVTLNGAETVRILSVAVGPDGTQSFRCFTGTTISAGDTIEGLAAFRVHLTSTHTPGEAIVDATVSQTLTFPVLPASDSNEDGQLTRLTAGIQTTLAVNLAQFSDGTAVLPEDEIHVAVRVDRLTDVKTIRAYFDVDADTGSTVTFLRNYFFYEWRASDIIEAIQATNAAEVTPLVVARQTVVTNDQLQQATEAAIAEYGRYYWLDPAWQAAYESSQQTSTTPRSRTNTGSAATGDLAVSTQLALGNSQWLDLRCRVSELIRVGTDTSRTLANVRAVEILISAETVGVVGTNPIAPDPLSVEYGDVWAAGGAGPDVGQVGDPYHYRYRYRSSATGAWSNPSPELRGGVIPRRQAVNLTAVPSADPQVDKIDWFRMGSALTQYTYVGTAENSADPFADTMPDTGIDGGEILRYDYFQPWPTQDLPRTGVCDVAGTAVRRVSGDNFNTSWAPGSPLIINGRAATLWASPASTDLLFVNENLLSGDDVAFEVIAATKLSQPLRSFWGDYNGLWFGCGDTDNPGSLYWTHGNNPECARDSDVLLVTPPSEPLQGGGIYNTFPFVFSSEQFYQILVSPTPTAGGRVRAIRTPCGRGSWTPWSWCIGIEGIYFLSSDGIYLTGGGSHAVSLTDPDLRDLFPKDGVPGRTINGIPAPDMTAQARLRLSYIAGFVYFDYLGIDANDHTLIFDVSGKRWFYDQTDLTGIRVRVEEPGEGVFNQILGAANGKLYEYDDDAIQDDGVDIGWDVWTSLVDGGQPRVTKQFGDIMVSLNAASSTDGISILPVANDGNATLTPEVVGAGATGRLPYVIDLDTGGGYLARNLGLRISGTLVAGDTGRPTLYLWEPAFLAKSDDIERRATDWDDLGYVGTKFVQGVILDANTFGEAKTIRVQKDGAVTAIDLTITHDGQITKEYPRESQAAPGWPPFITQMVRIIGTDDLPWQLLNYRFVWEPHPELATQWETQFTTHDLKGYLSVRDAVIAHCSEGNIRLRVIYDDGETTDYTIAASGGTDMAFYNRTYLPLVGRKGIAVQYQLRSGCPFRLFKRDCSVRVYDWGSGQTYLQTMPFGGPHRADGAAI